MGRLLSIETGYTCNSRCGFCHQVSYRRAPGVAADLSTDEIKDKIRWGARSGYDQVAFSGGEVTIRPDAVELLAFARQQGFRQIGLTTNGRMLAYPGFSAALVAAGVSTVNLSIHGHTAELHDMLAHAPGSFEQAIRGLDNLRAAADRHRRRVDLMSMTLATPANVDHFADIVRLLGGKGVRLHMLQPFIVNEDNLESADRFLCGYERIEAALRAGIEAARAHDGKVKLYNIPPCLLRDVADRVDLPRYHTEVFSRHDRDEAADADGAVWGFYRVAACRGCPDAWDCPGFRREYFPEEPLVAECVAALGAGERGELWLAGTELLSRGGLLRLVAGARAAGARRVALTTGGGHRLGRALHDVAIEAGVDELVLVARWRDPAADDPRTREVGHGDRLRQAAERAVAVARRGPLAVGLAFGVQELLVDGALAELEELRAAGVERFYASISYEPQHRDLTRVRPDADRLRAGIEALRRAMAGGGRFEFVDHDTPEGMLPPEQGREQLAALLPRRDGGALVPRTRIAGPDYYFITRSLPHCVTIVPPRKGPPPVDGATVPEVAAERLARGAAAR